MFNTNEINLNSHYIPSDIINKQIIVEFQTLFKKYFVLMLNKAVNKGLSKLGDEEKIIQYHMRMRQILLHDPRITRMLDRLDVSKEARDMDMPGWKFHGLQGARKGTWSVTVTGNWRITFKFEKSCAFDVDLEDYH